MGHVCRGQDQVELKTYFSEKRNIRFISPRCRGDNTASMKPREKV